MLKKITKLKVKQPSENKIFPTSKISTDMTEKKLIFLVYKELTQSNMKNVNT